MARSKKEIDKELMYKKLMPTAQTGDDNAPEQPAQPLPLSIPATPPPLPVQAAPAPAEPPAADTVQSDEASAVPSAASAIVSGSVPQPADDIVNVMELLVEARIDAAMDKFRCCTCDKCRKDVTAITLNKLVPSYILSSDNAKRIEIETKYAGQVATALVQAILTVKARPSHE